VRKRTRSAHQGRYKTRHDLTQRLIEFGGHLPAPAALNAPSNLGNLQELRFLHSLGRPETFNGRDVDGC
jgi:hypothetical protein